MTSGEGSSHPKTQTAGLHLRGWLVGMVLAGLVLTGGCGGAPPESESSRAATSAPAASPPASPVAVPIRFTDVTSTARLSFRHDAGATGNKWYPETMGAGGGFFDYDGDGLVDILLVNGRHWPDERQQPEPTMRLFRNQGDGTFRDVTRQSRLDVPLYGMGMAAADYDNDGDQDLVVTAYQQTVLFRNEGNGTFTDISLQAGIVQGAWSTAAVFVDVDRDGWLDLLVGQYVDWTPDQEANLDCTYGTPHKDYCAVLHFKGQGLRLYRNLGNGRFQDVTQQAGLVAPNARVLGFSIVDYNQDNWPDILVANDLTPSLFFANQGNGTFRDIGVQSGLVMDEGGVAFAGMGIDATSINNDDQLCVAIGNFAGQPTTLHCQVRVHDRTLPDVFTEQSHRAGLARPTLRMVTFGLFFFDADLDGWQDLFILNGHVVNEQLLRNVPYAQRPQLFRNRHDGTFAEVQPDAASGLNFRLIGRSAAYADYDHDGDLDILLTANQGPAYLLRNDTPRPGHFLRVMAQGSRSNRDGIGARVRLYTGRRQLTGMIRTGSSYLSQSETTLTFGLAQDEPIDRLEVTWPSGVVDVFRQLQPDATFVAREGMAAAQANVAQSPPASGLPEDSLRLKHTAVAHYQAGRFQAAVGAFERVLQRQPEDYMVQQYLIELYWRQGAHNQARALLTAMRETLPDANFLMQFAFHLEDVQLHDLADQIYLEALRLDPGLAEAHYRLGKNALQAGRYEDAIASFRQALQRHTTLVDAHQGIGLAYAEQGKDTQAETEFREALRLAPDFAEAYIHLGQLYVRAGRLDEAVAAYKRVIKLQPERAQGYHNLGSVYAAAGRVEDAIRQFQEALQRDARLLSAHNDLGTLYAERGDLEQALAEFRTALQIDAKSVQARFNLGVGYLRQGRLEAAIQQFRHVLKLAPAQSEAHYMLAVAYAQQGQADAMLGALQETVRLDPKHAGAHSALASLYFQRRQYDLAWQHGNRAAQLGASVQPLLDAIRQARTQTP